MASSADDRVERAARAAELRRQGLSLRAIADQLGVTAPTVRRDLLTAGKRRPRRSKVQARTLDAHLAEMTEAQRRDLARRLLAWREVDAASARRSL
ncbi:MAG: helix-turn-helix domain-containing protein [Actinomycetota bacterium]|nr:helix-turn-helix domain-containing protein [Actinomycetota bacterium]